ncbi:hypothetical protein RHSIM_Rhsim05G0026100 [Rhododendron simsii]|uniref:Integrase catalytic domain-containing protein n=1 Tax=Rhododendron simsii TaxID=118357 RepID=A0A834LMB8_RHOSS|nr:hypothetical protein RHSIM_Rhsim05G0026100 [Rhododendron simsii]
MALSPSSKYPYPYALNISNFVSLRLNQSNFLLWKTQFMGLIESQDMLGFIDGGYPMPAQYTTSNAEGANVVRKIPNPDYVQWRRSDRLLRGWITGTLSEEVLGLVVGLETSAEVWSALLESFAQASQEREFYLNQKLQFHSRKDCKSMADYIRIFKEICDDLAAIGQPIHERQKVFGLLKGLGTGYESFITTMMKPPIPTYKELVPLLQGHETMKTFHSPEVFGEGNPNAAFIGQRHQGSQGGKYYRRGNQGQTQGRTSFNSRGRGFMQASGFSNQAGTHHNQQPAATHQNGPRKQQQRGEDQEVVCQICNKTRHTAVDCWQRFNQTYQPNDAAQALAAMTISDGQDNAWFPDTGATQHMTSDYGKLQNCTPYFGSDKIMVGNGDTLHITHVGNASLNMGNKEIKLNNVLVVPEIKKNLLSVSQMTTQLPYDFEFSANDFVIKHRETKRVIAKGSRSGGLYSLKPKNAEVFFSTRFRVVNDDVWHQRLGHPNMRVVNHLKKNKLISSSNNKPIDFICSSCQLGKACRLPFLSIEDHCENPIEKIHCDLWGPAPVVSFQKFRFYVIFVDECTRFTWFFPLRRKSDFFPCFVTFHKFLRNQFGKNPKIFQSDGGGEFSDKKFLAYLSENGIKHQLSCPGVHEQNGMAERKHRNVTELGLTMLFAGHVPKRYWVEAFGTATWLINRQPTRVLNMLSPIEKLTGKKPNYASLRVFGSRCFPYLRDYAKNKFDPKSLPCVFLGYSEFYKGYRCLYPPTGRVYLSRHVVFDERTFPFKEPSSLFSELSDHSELVSFHDWISGFEQASTCEEQSSQENHVQSGFAPISQGDFHDVADEGSESLATEPNQVSTLEPPSLATLSRENVTELPINQAEHEEMDSQSAPHSAMENSSSSSQPNTHSMATRAQSGIVKANPKYSAKEYALLSYDVPAEPKSIKSALQHPDDIILTGDNSAHLQDFMSKLHKEFAMKDLGYLHYFLGIEVHRFSGGLLLNQKKYAAELLDRAHMGNCKPLSTPMVANPRLPPNVVENDEELQYKERKVGLENDEELQIEIPKWKLFTLAKRDQSVFSEGT